MPEDSSVRPEDITVVSGDTSTIQLGLGGFASRQTVTAGNSVHLAARAVREKAIAAAALLLDVPPDNLDIRDGGKGYAVSIIKAGLTAVGRDGGRVRPPLTDLTEDERAELATLVQKVS